MSAILIPGDVFLTRWEGLDEENNASPGYFNHACIYYGDNLIIESQEAHGIIYSDLEKFKNRYPIYVVLRYNNIEDSAKVAVVAKTMIGIPYRKIASVFHFLRNSRRGENCVSMVRKCYAILGQDPGWKIPDHIWNDKSFQVVDTKQDADWISPDNRLDGVLGTDA